MSSLTDFLLTWWYTLCISSCLAILSSLARFSIFFLVSVVLSGWIVLFKCAINISEFSINKDDIGVSGNEHGSALGTNTPLLAAFQYFLTIQHTQVQPILIYSELSAIDQVLTLHLDLCTDIWSCSQLFYGSISTFGICGFLQTVAANRWSVQYVSHLWHTRSALVSWIGGSWTLCWLGTDLSFYLLSFLYLLLISSVLISEAPKFLISYPLGMWFLSPGPCVLTLAISPLV